MKKITRQVWSHRSLSSGKRYYVTDVRGDSACDINDFPSLVRAVAIISFKNPDFALFYRGQDKDYQLRFNKTTLRPSIYRNWGSGKTRGRLMKERFENLVLATKLLRNKFSAKKLDSRYRIFQYTEVAWAILQHYEIITTPLMDFTVSLRVASSFATCGPGTHGFLYVIGLPYPQGSISYYSEQQMLNLRLLSICPPEALRPYFQDGYLVGSFPHREHSGYTGKLDFGHRLLAKFRLPKVGFWGRSYHAIPDDALYPRDDQVKIICDEVKEELNN